jgi:plasmid stabilization system protein ParE
MRVVFTPEAEEQAERCDTWWRENRTSSRDLFARELDETKRLLLETPKLGTVHAVLDGLPVRRVLLRFRLRPTSGTKPVQQAHGECAA